MHTALGVYNFRSMKVWFFMCRRSSIQVMVIKLVTCIIPLILLEMILGWIRIQFDEMDEMLKALIIRVLAPIGVVEFEHLHKCDK